MSSGKRKPAVRPYPARPSSPVQVIQPIPLMSRKLPMDLDPDPWEDEDQETEESPMQAAKRGRQKISRVIHARHQNGKTCAVSGPFPDGLFRSNTRKTVKEVLKLGTASMYVHGETDRDDRYAMVLISDVVEILSGENEFGEVSP